MTYAQMVTLEQEYIKAEEACLSNQSYTIKDRTYTRADLGDIQRGRKELAEQIALIQQGGGIRVRRFVPRDD